MPVLAITESMLTFGRIENEEPAVYTSSRLATTQTLEVEI